MFGFTVRPQQAEELNPHLSLFGVGDEPKWVGHSGNMLFRPYDLESFGVNPTDSRIAARVAFAAERSVVGKFRIMPATHVGQVAILATRSSQGSRYSAAIAIPCKDRRFSMSRDAIVVEPLTENPPHHLLDDPTAGLYTCVRQAIYNVINSEATE